MVLDFFGSPSWVRLPGHCNTVYKTGGLAGYSNPLYEHAYFVSDQIDKNVYVVRGSLWGEACEGSLPLVLFYGLKEWGVFIGSCMQCSFIWEERQGIGNDESWNVFEVLVWKPMLWMKCWHGKTKEVLYFWPFVLLTLKRQVIVFGRREKISVGCSTFHY
jgi:hypothetical protein